MEGKGLRVGFAHCPTESISMDMYSVYGINMCKHCNLKVSTRVKYRTDWWNHVLNQLLVFHVLTVVWPSAQGRSGDGLVALDRFGSQIFARAELDVSDSIGLRVPCRNPMNLLCKDCFWNGTP